jgi:hypothetical protein
MGQVLLWDVHFRFQPFSKTKYANLAPKHTTNQITHHSPHAPQQHTTTPLHLNNTTTPQHKNKTTLQNTIAIDHK